MSVFAPGTKRDYSMRATGTILVIEKPGRENMSEYKMAEGYDDCKA